MSRKYPKWVNGILLWERQRSHQRPHWVKKATPRIYCVSMRLKALYDALEAVHGHSGWRIDIYEDVRERPGCK